MDSTALYDAVATQDTVTLIRSALRALLRVCDSALALELRAALERDDDYSTAGKPACDWDDAEARDQLIDALARDGFAALGLLEGRSLSPDTKDAVQLLATVLGQDLETEQGCFRIARGVATDRVISTVDPEARHGHKTAARAFDGYKGHLAIDPDSEVITATTVTAANVGDAGAAEALLADVLPAASVPAPAQAGPECIAVYGDASYGTADMLERLQSAGIEANTKVQSPPAPHGKLSQDAFSIDTQAGTVRCPAGVLVQLRRRADGSALAKFGQHCTRCSKRDACTSSEHGRVVHVHRKHDVLQRARARQADEAWKRHYRATRPKVERKLGHMMRRRHGGRRARVRGRLRVGHDFALLGAAINLQRLAMLGVYFDGRGWQR